LLGLHGRARSTILESKQKPSVGLRSKQMLLTFFHGRASNYVQAEGEGVRVQYIFMSSYLYVYILIYQYLSISLEPHFGHLERNDTYSIHLVRFHLCPHRKHLIFMRTFVSSLDYYRPSIKHQSLHLDTSSLQAFCFCKPSVCSGAPSFTDCFLGLTGYI